MGSIRSAWPVRLWLTISGISERCVTKSIQRWSKQDAKQGGGRLQNLPLYRPGRGGNARSKIGRNSPGNPLPRREDFPGRCQYMVGCKVVA